MNTIRPALAADAGAIALIYNHYIRETVITFEEDEIDSQQMLARMNAGLADNFPWLVAEMDGKVAGYAYAARWKARSAYRFAAEVSVYLAREVIGNGLGSQLYARLFAELKDRGIHAVIGGIALPNAASVALHEKFGMEKAAHFKSVGFKFDRWIDVGYWQRILAP